MARNVPTELIVVNADTRRPVIDIDPLTVDTCGTYWVRSDTPALPAFVGAARMYADAAGVAVDIVASVDPDRSFEAGCVTCHRFVRLVDTTPDDGALACRYCD